MAEVLNYWLIFAQRILAVTGAIDGRSYFEVLPNDSQSISVSSGDGWCLEIGGSGTICAAVRAEQVQFCEYDSSEQW
jgi:pyruvate/2-oxoacid:ferredoxin oxidoreductase beta subunit